MSCCQCQAIETFFSPKIATRELKKFHRKGPEKTTRMLLDELKKTGIENLGLLDIGGGIGAIQHDLLEAGAARATNVDASSNYQRIAREEAERRGYADKLTFHYGNFIDIAPDLAAHDIVTLDRVICCFPDMPQLVQSSSARARKFYGVVFPRDTWWARLTFKFGNIGLWILRNPFRAFVHPTAAVEAILSAQGWRRQFYGKTLLWQVILYTK